MDIISYTKAREVEKFSQKRLLQCSNFGWTNTNQLTAGTATGITSRTLHVAHGYSSDIRLIFANYYIDNTIHTDAENSVPVTLKASIEINGALYSCRFNGMKTKTLQPGEMVVSDPVGIVLEKDEVFYVRVFHQVPADGDSHPSGYAANWRSSGDLTESGTVSSYDYYGFAPIAVIGNTKQVSVLGVGDSILGGSGDTGLTDNGRVVYNRGFLTRALMDNTAFLNLSKHGQKIVDYLNPNMLWARNNFFEYSTHAFVEVGINDIKGGESAESVKSNMIQLWTLLKQRGMKVYQSTITPESTSTDGWTTTENQTRTGAMAVRDQINDWIRTKPTPLDGVFEVADVVETGRNTGIWKVGYTADGLHPNATGHAAIAAAIDVSMFN